LIYLLIGQPRTGKSTVAIDLAINRYASQGRRVVANFPIDFAPACERPGTLLAKASARVIPDRPNRSDLDSIGEGGVDEEHAGLLIIDEAGTWCNARTWQGEDRMAILDWLTQSGKRYWDVILIAHSVGMLDKQLRESVCEMVARIRRTDRVRILGYRLPRVHVAVVRYGTDPQGPILERWVYRGTVAHLCYGSYRLFGPGKGHYSVRPAMETKFAKKPKRLTFADLRAFVNRAPVVLFAMLCVALHLATRDQMFHRAARSAPAPEAQGLGLSDYKQCLRPLIV